MSHPVTPFAVAAAALLLIGAGGAGVAAGAPTASATDARANALAAGESAAENPTGAVEQLDRFLESVLDLVRTLNQLFGAGGESEGGEAGG